LKIHKKPIQVFEYDRLTVTDSLFEKRHLDALLKLNESHNFEYFDSIPNGIRFKQYVGIIQIDDLTIEIYPKVDRNDEDGPWKKVLIQMLIACRKIKASTYGEANVNKQNLNLLELYFSIYLSELSGLFKQGLIKQYRKESSNISSLKGKLLFEKNINHNIVHQERFYNEHQVYDKDHTLHQILNAALCIVEEFTRATYLHDTCKRIQLDFPEVSEIKISKKLLDGFRLSRKAKPYSKAFDIARLILLNYSPDISSGREKMLAILFDMNKLWEEYVVVKLSEVIPDNYSIIAQDSKAFWGYNSLQPDIVINNGEETFILDTKWKRPGNSSASSQDLRQMYTYNRFWNASKAILLYPGDPLPNNFEQFYNEADPIKHYCKMAFVNVLDSEGKLNTDLGLKIINELEIKTTSSSGNSLKH
jgi:5-methylcytosine-specific restriction enzyme subunit McrC